MATKEKLLELMESNKGKYLSGQEIARQLGVTRAAVWKAAASLKKDGYAIDATVGKGYNLSTKTDILSPQGVQKYLKQECSGIDITFLPSTTSTNTIARDKANSGAPEGCVVMANEQTAGRGRRGRSFYAPSGTGIYISLLLRPKNYPAKQAVRITTAAAVAVCEAIETVSGEEARIKWVNDVFVRGKKVCGILTEASFGLENAMVEYAVLGIGLNVYVPKGGFPKDIEQVAGAVFETPHDDVKNRLAAEFLNRFMAYYATLDKPEHVEKYRTRNLAIGREISVISANGTRSAKALGVDDECRLLVKYDNGEEESLFSGEISIRL